MNSGVVGFRTSRLSLGFQWRRAQRSGEAVAENISGHILSGGDVDSIHDETESVHNDVKSTESHEKIEQTIFFHNHIRPLLILQYENHGGLTGMFFLNIFRYMYVRTAE